MKFLRLVWLSLIFCMACTESKDDIEFIQKAVEDEEAIFSMRESTKDPVVNEEERLMYMTSFLIGKAIINNKEAGDYFNQNIVSKKVTKIDLVRLLNLDFTESNPFEIEFQLQFNIYNWHTSPVAGGPVPPTTTAEPDAIRWGGIFGAETLYYQYLVEILNNRELELYFPNKNTFINELQDLTTYFMNYNSLTCLWSLDYFSIYSDGLILYSDGNGDYLPESFDFLTTNSFVIILRDKMSL